MADLVPLTHSIAQPDLAAPSAEPATRFRPHGGARIVRRAHLDGQVGWPLNEAHGRVVVARTRRRGNALRSDERGVGRLDWMARIVDPETRLRADGFASLGVLLGIAFEGRADAEGQHA